LLVAVRTFHGFFKEAQQLKVVLRILPVWRTTPSRKDSGWTFLGSILNCAVGQDISIRRKSVCDYGRLRSENRVNECKRDLSPVETIADALDFTSGWRTNRPEPRSLTSPKSVSGQHVVLATIHLLLTEDKDEVFCTSIPLVQVPAKLLKILIAALSLSVAY
jgi:hypothetical protein